MEIEEFRTCTTCGIPKPITDFYFDRTKKGNRQNRCKVCERARVKRYEDEITGGARMVRMYPNTYSDDRQKDATFDLMKRMGWSYNEEKGIWWKLPMKDRDGNWNIPKQEVVVEEPKPKIKKKYDYCENIIKKRKEQLKTPPPEYKGRIKKMKENSLSTEQIIAIRKEYTETKATQVKLAKKYKVSQSYINQIIHYKI